VAAKVAKPWWCWRAINVFRDETNLTAAPALWSRIADALDQSSHFVLLASPDATQSKWIKREIRYWLGDRNAGVLEGPDLDAPIANPKPERVATLLIALTAGEIIWDEKAGNSGDFDWSKTNAVPRQLSGVFREEPQWVDVRKIVEREELRASLSRSNAEFMRAVAQLAAPIRGIADFSRLVSEDYRQYRRTISTAWAAAGVLAFVTVAAVSQWRTAVDQRDRAVHAEGAANKANAQAQASAAQATANAAEAKANADTAEANAHKAEANAESARANLREAQTEQSRFLIDQSRQRRLTDPGSAVLLALEALPDATGVDRPYIPEAELRLDGAWRDLREWLVLSHEDGVSSATFSPDGKRIVTASWDKTARIWDAESGKLIGVPLTGHEGGVWSAAFSPDGKRIVTASSDKTARVWNAANGRPIGKPLIGDDDVVNSAAFSPDGNRIVTASDKMARVWDAASGKPIGEPFKGHDNVVLSTAFSPDGKRIVTASWDKTARIWDAESGKLIGVPLTGHEGGVWSAAFSPDGKRIRYRVFGQDGARLERRERQADRQAAYKR
jgi:hypothetical protein